MEWIQDEKQSIHSVQEKQQMLNLFRSSVLDYLCKSITFEFHIFVAIELWIEYLDFIFEDMESDSPLLNEDQVREEYKKALSFAGFHFSQVYFGSYVF